MKHTFEKLKEAISAFNTATLNELNSSEIGNFNGEPCASVVIASDARHHPLGECFCGRTSKGYTGSNTFVDTCLTLANASGGVKRSVAVGAVIDDETSGVVAELPVVLAVGINYSQGSKHLKKPVPLVESLGMRKRLGVVFKFLANEKCAAIAGELKVYHLVGSNFFPWITNKTWSSYDFNSIEEAALIRCCGHADPVKYVANLIAKVQPVAVVFHGANNAVPYLAISVIASSLCGSSTEVDAIFCDNLAPSLQPGISNAIRLGNCRLSQTTAKREHLPLTDFDE